MISFKQALKSKHTEEYLHLAGNTAILALHGGGIEPGTEQIARYIAKKTNSSLYVFSAREEEDNWKYHVTSSKISPSDSVKLGKLVSHCKQAVSLHGHDRNEEEVYIAGGNKDLKERIASSIRKTLPNRFRVVNTLDKIPKALRADSPTQILNYFKKNGVQIELPSSLRKVFRGRGRLLYENRILYTDTKKLAEGVWRMIGR